jgi:hypothetical protein
MNLSRVGFKHTTPVFELAKTVFASGHTANVIFITRHLSIFNIVLLLTDWG